MQKDILISTEMRVGELTRLNISDLNLQDRSCIVLGKNRLKISGMHYAMVSQNNVKISHRKYIG